MKKILVIGSADSVFVKDFISQTAAQGVTVDLISFSGFEKNKNVRNEASVVLSSKGKFGVVTRQFELFLKTRSALKKMETGYDAIILHFIFFFLAPHVFLMRRMTKNIVAVIWGSDFYRSGAAKGLIQKIVYRASRNIVFTNPATRDEFEKKNKSIPRERLKIARFGLPVLEEIEKIKAAGVGRAEICESFGLPAEKFLVFIGYNSNLAQQQIFVIEEFAKLKESTKDKAVLVFTLGYGDKSAEQKIKDSLRQNKISRYFVFNKFYESQEIACLRCVTDLLINIQPTDQFSGSMQEALYAGGRVIAGKWLPYGAIIDAEAKIRSIENLDEIARAMELEINLGFEEVKRVSEKTRRFIETKSSWRENLKIWNEIIF